MTLARRLSLLAQTLRRLPEFGNPTLDDLQNWVKEELGSIDALDRPSKNLQAIAPRYIYHIAASTLPISLWQTLLRGLVLGSYNIVKLPSNVRPETYRRFSDALPTSLRKMVTYQRQFDLRTFQQADAIIALASDATIQELRRHLLPHQRFIAYGTKWSFLCGTFYSQPSNSKVSILHAVARDFLTYHHTGCLSPRAIFLSPQDDALDFAKGLLDVIVHNKSQSHSPPLSLTLSEKLLIQDCRARAHFKRQPLFFSEIEGWPYTLIVQSLSEFQMVDAPFVLPIVSLSSWNQLSELKSLSNKISTVGFFGSVPSLVEKIWIELGATRFCPAGSMQFPPLNWKHDGDYTLRPLIRWVSKDGASISAP
ncbi:MAG: acyl-CoA reductase [Verrucomicrobiae bacterium]|nr:acyl-CoA reductase [Verrucomicrobiae bacterium]